MGIDSSFAMCDESIVIAVGDLDASLVDVVELGAALVEADAVVTAAADDGVVIVVVVVLAVLVSDCCDWMSAASRTRVALASR
jgi:hypothetical protein